MMPPALRIFAHFGDAPVLHLGGNLHGKAAGIEQRQPADAGMSLA